MLSPDVAVTELARLVDRELNDLLRARRERDLTRGCRGVSPSNYEFDRLTHFGEVHPEGIEHPCRDALAFTYKAEKEVFGTYVVVVEADRFILRESQHSLRPIVEAIERTSATFDAREPLPRGSRSALRRGIADGVIARRRAARPRDPHLRGDDDERRDQAAGEAGYQRDDDVARVHVRPSANS